MGDLLVFYIEAVKSDGSNISFSFSNPKVNISGQWLQNTFLPAASPVLGIVEITAAYYLATERTDLI